MDVKSGDPAEQTNGKKCKPIVPPKPEKARLQAFVKMLEFDQLTNKTIGSVSDLSLGVTDGRDCQESEALNGEVDMNVEESGSNDPFNSSLQTVIDLSGCCIDEDDPGEPLPESGVTVSKLARCPLASMESLSDTMWASVCDLTNATMDKYSSENKTVQEVAKDNSESSNERSEDTRDTVNNICSIVDKDSCHNNDTCYVSEHMEINNSDKRSDVEGILPNQINEGRTDGEDSIISTNCAENNTKEKENDNGNDTENIVCNNITVEEQSQASEVPKNQEENRHWEDEALHEDMEKCLEESIPIMSQTIKEYLASCDSVGELQQEIADYYDSECDLDIETGCGDSMCSQERLEITGASVNGMESRGELEGFSFRTEENVDVTFTGASQAGERLEDNSMKNQDRAEVTGLNIDENEKLLNGIKSHEEIKETENGGIGDETFTEKLDRERYRVDGKERSESPPARLMDLKDADTALECKDWSKSSKSSKCSSQPLCASTPVYVNKACSRQPTEVSDYPSMSTFKPSVSVSSKGSTSEPLCASTPVVKPNKGLRVRDMNIMSENVGGEMTEKPRKLNLIADLTEILPVDVTDVLMCKMKNKENLKHKENKEKEKVKERKKLERNEKERGSKRDKKMKGTRKEKFKEYLGPGLTSAPVSENEGDMTTCTLTEYKGFGLTGPLPEKNFVSKVDQEWVKDVSTKPGAHDSASCVQKVADQRPAGLEGFLLPTVNTNAVRARFQSFNPHAVPNELKQPGNMAHVDTFGKRAVFNRYFSVPEIGCRQSTLYPVPEHKQLRNVQSHGVLPNHPSNIHAAYPPLSNIYPNMPFANFANPSLRTNLTENYAYLPSKPMSGHNPSLASLPVPPWPSTSSGEPVCLQPDQIYPDSLVSLTLGPKGSNSQTKGGSCLSKGEKSEGSSVEKHGQEVEVDPAAFQNEGRWLFGFKVTSLILFAVCLYLIACCLSSKSFNKKRISKILAYIKIINLQKYSFGEHFFS